MKIEKVKQLKLVQKIIDLSVENPNAEIKFCVSDEISGDWGWTNHKIKRVELTKWIEINERIYTDEIPAKDEIDEMLYKDGIDSAILEQQIDKYFNENAVDAICVFTEAVFA